MFTYGPPSESESRRLAAGMGALVRTLRVERGWTQVELRRRSGVRSGPYERGTGRPSWTGACRLAVAFFPDDHAAAKACAERMAELAGPSMLASPMMPPALVRELTVSVLLATCRRFGVDTDDDQVRLVLWEELRASFGDERDSGVPVAPLAIGGAA